MDVLSEVLKVVRLEGALFFNAEFSAPWCISAAQSAAFAPYLRPGAQHLIFFHFLREGRAYARLPDGGREELSAGDVVMLPHGDAHLLGNGSPEKPVDSLRTFAKNLSQGLKLARFGGGGLVIAKLSEVLFVETLRRYINALPADQTGWLAGARDPQIGQAMALLHKEPAHPWTIQELARRVGLSRTRLAERFRHFLGEPPMAYLAQWRLKMGAEILRSSGESVAEVAGAVGYGSEVAFNRAFKREFDSPPAQFRRQRHALTHSAEIHS